MCWLQNYVRPRRSAQWWTRTGVLLTTNPLQTNLYNYRVVLEFKLTWQYSRQHLSSLHLISSRRLPHNIPTCIKRYRTISSLLSSASGIPWLWSFSSITEQIATRLVSLNWGSCSLLLLKSLWLGPALISVPLSFLFGFLLEIRSPFAWAKLRHTVTADFFIWDKTLLGWIWSMTPLAFCFFQYSVARE